MEKEKYYWTAKDDALLKELYLSMMPIEEIAKRLGRTKNSIGFRAHQLGLKRHKRYNGCKEDCFNCPYPDCMKQGGFSESY